MSVWGKIVPFLLCSRVESEEVKDVYVTLCNSTSFVACVFFITVAVEVGIVGEVPPTVGVAVDLVVGIDTPPEEMAVVVGAAEMIVEMTVEMTELATTVGEVVICKFVCACN